jgi:peptide-methionine (S)-S-oxide reductase
VGYTGAKLANPTYRRMGGHAEAFQLDFDPTRVSYEELLALFWKQHHPHQESYGRQYRIAAFPGDAAQLAAAEASKAAIAEQTKRPVLTAIEPLETFWLAEDYHQKYSLRRHSDLLAAFHAYSPRELVDSTVAARLNSYVAGHGTREQLAAEIDSFGLTESMRSRLARSVER